jgi:hypothetical protein
VELPAQPAASPGGREVRHHHEQASVCPPSQRGSYALECNRGAPCDASGNPHCKQGKSCGATTGHATKGGAATQT